jgi:hypothetical protein
MKWDGLLLIAVVVLLVLVDLLTFHDVFEPHSVRDWLILAVSILVFTYVVKVWIQRIRVV